MSVFQITSGKIFHNSHMNLRFKYLRSLRQPSLRKTANNINRMMNEFISIFENLWIAIMGAEKEMQLTGIIKKSGDYYVALCIEINVSSQGESIEEARKMLQEACDEYLSFMKDEGLVDEIKSVPVDILREFLMDDVECVRPSSSWVYSESITFEVCASV